MPLYFQLAAALKDELDTGAWPPGARFLTEREIGEAFPVSRTVIRRALDMLVADGAIVRIQGSGTFVTPPRSKAPLSGLVETILKHRDYVDLSVLTVREESPDPAVAQLLEMGAQPTSIVHATAVMRIDKQPVCLVESYSVANLVPWLLPTVETLQSGIKRPINVDIDLSRAPVSIELTYFGDWEGPLVGTSAGDPALMGRLVQFGRPKDEARERALEFAYLLCRSDSAQFSFELG